MMEFNPDGSLKIGGVLAREKEEKNAKFMNERCIRIEKELVREAAPKKCILHIKLSDKLNNEGFVERIHSVFAGESEVLTKLHKISDKEYEIEVGTCLRRCTDCNNLIGRFRGALNGNIIEEKGSCTHEKREFAYEDYFD